MVERDRERDCVWRKHLRRVTPLLRLTQGPPTFRFLDGPRTRGLDPRSRSPRSGCALPPSCCLPLFALRSIALPEELDRPGETRKEMEEEKCGVEKAVKPDRNSPP